MSTLRLKHVCTVVDLRAGSRRLPLLAVSIHHGVVPRDQLTDDEPRATDLSAYRLCEPGDIVLNRMRAFQGAIGMASVRGLVSPDYLVLRPRQRALGRYLHYLFRSTEFVGEMIARLRGIGSTDTGTVRTPRINAEDLLDIDVRLPPIDEQQATADYLDRETTRINALVGSKQRAIALYAERRTSLRDRAFRYDSGIRLKHVLVGPMAYGVLVPEFVTDGERVPMIRTYNLTSRGQVDHQDIAEIPRSLADQYRRTYVQEGDVILSVVGSMGRAAVVSSAEEGANLNRPLARLRPSRQLPARLLWHWTQSTQFADAAKLATGGGTAQPTLNLGDLSNFRVGLPTDVKKWTEVFAHLDMGCRLLDRLEHAAGRQVELLTERRRALITAAVTGALPIPVAV